MKLRWLQEQVYEANIALQKRGLVFGSFGNVSGIDRATGMVAIKPSGVPYTDLTPGIIPIVDLDNNVVEGDLRPSTDTPTHTHLYRSLLGIQGIAHCHSTYATAWAQARIGIPCLGTTHADYVNGEIPCTERLTPVQMNNYEEETGVNIVSILKSLPEKDCSMVLVAGHGPFTWGKTPYEAVENACILEYLAKVTLLSRSIESNCSPLESYIREKHYQRKHGSDAYYGQQNGACDKK